MVGQVLTLDANGVVYINIGGSGGGGSALTVQDEGGNINTDVRTADFIGADVSVFQDPIDPRKVLIYIPSIAFASHYNTTDGATIGTVADITTSVRNVATPTAEGVPYKIGGWTGGTSHPCHRTDSLIYNNTSDISFSTNVSTTIEVNVYDADGITVLASHTTVPIVGNYDNTVNNIRIQITNWTPDYIKYRGRILVTITMSAILPPGGRHSVEITHHNGIEGDFTKTQNDIFYDDETNLPILTGVTITENAGGISTLFLSGIEYYTTGSQFILNILDLDNPNSDSYPNNIVDVDGSEYGLPSLLLSTGVITGWTNDFDNIDDTYTESGWAISAANFTTVSTTANVNARTKDWTDGAWQPSTNSNILVETHVTTSTRLVEYFYDEQWRCPATGNFDLSAQRVWTSNNDLLITDACFISGGAERNVTDFTVYNPNGVTQPDYASLGMNATVYLYREFQHDGTASSSMRINISGTYTSLEYKLAKAWDGTPTGGTVWVDALIAYNFGQWNNGNPTGGTGGQTTTGAGYVDVTFGSNNIINTSDTVYIRIGFAAGHRITVLNVVFS